MLITKFFITLKQYGFTQCHADNNMFTYSDSIILMVYVDDILIIGISKDLIQQIIAYMTKAFNVKNLGTLKYFLGIEATRNDSGIYLHQRDILIDTGLMEQNLVKFL